MGLFRKSLWLSTGLCAALHAQQHLSRIDVQHYAINAEIKPASQSITAQVTVDFTPLDEGIASIPFELNNALNVSKITDEQGHVLQPARTQNDFTVRVALPASLQKGTKHSITFNYEGRLGGEEDSPVYGIKFAAIHEDFAFLLYPAPLVSRERLHHGSLLSGFDRPRSRRLQRAGERRRGRQFRRVYL